jgi:hypothetical protein
MKRKNKAILQWIYRRRIAGKILPPLEGLGLSFNDIDNSQYIPLLYKLYSGPIPFPLPVNIAVPSILGITTNGSRLLLNVGTWSGIITSFEAEIRSVEGSPVVYLARQTVTASTTFSIPDTAVGKSIELRVWAVNGEASTLATSAAFGPITAEGDIFIGAVAFNKAAVDLSSQPYPWVQITFPAGDDSTPYAMAGPPAKAFPGRSETYMIGGTIFGSAPPNFNSNLQISTNTSSGLSRRKGRLQMANAFSVMRVEFSGLVPGAVYKFYMGAGSSSTTTTPNWRFGDELGNPIKDGGGTTDIPAIVGSNVLSSQVRDATGAIKAEATWDSESLFGGLPQEVTCPASGKVTISRDSGIAGQINCIAITKKVL